MDRKIYLYLQDMKKRGVDSNVTAPKTYYLLWSNGLAVRPPIFGHFIVNMLVTVIQASLILLLIRFICLEYAFKLIFPIIPTCSADESMYAVVIFAILFGLFKAGQYLKTAKNLSLPKWENYSPVDL